MGAGEPSRAVVDVGSGSERDRLGFGCGGRGGGGGGGSEGDREGGMVFPGKEGAGGAVNESVHGGAERPAKDGGNGHVVAQGDGKEDGAAIREGVREVVGNDGAKKAMEVGGFEGVNVADCACEANGFKWVLGVVEIDEAMDARRVGGSEMLVV